MASSVVCAMVCVLFSSQAFFLTLIQIQINNKKMFNSLFVGYEELLRLQFVLSALAFGLNNSSYLTRPHSIIV